MGAQHGSMASRKWMKPLHIEDLEQTETVSNPNETPIRIHNLASRLGITARALRYYETVGLIRPYRTTGRTRLYDQRAQRTAAKVVMLRRASFSCEEIAELMRGDARAEFRQKVQLGLRTRLENLDQHRKELISILNSLE